jgi:hypothetical protein
MLCVSAISRTVIPHLGQRVPIPQSLAIKTTVASAECRQLPQPSGMSTERAAAPIHSAWYRLLDLRRQRCLWMLYSKKAASRSCSGGAKMPCVRPHRCDHRLASGTLQEREHLNPALAIALPGGYFDKLGLPRLHRPSRR